MSIVALLVPKIFVSADDDLNLVSTNTVESEYVYDTLFYIPEYDFTMLGQTEKSKATLISPSNKAYDATKVKLNETGYWTLKFTPFNSVFEIGFTVYKPTYEVTSDKGSVTYGETNFYSKNETGLFVNIPKNSVFKYNDVINLTGLNKSQNVLEFGIVPNSIGVSDVGRVFVYLTDIYDPSNYIVYRINNPNNRESGYDGMGTLSASFSGAGHFLGTENSGKKIVNGETVDVVSYKVDDMYFGAYTPFAFSGTTSKLGSRSPITMISYDDATKQAHANSKMWYGEPINKNLRTLIADLSKDEYSDCVLSNVQEGFLKPFGGFTTGEVYLSIMAEDYSSPNCNVFIKSIYGADLSKTKSYDKNAPNIIIDTEGYSVDDLPKAEINKPYKIFNALATDNELSDLRVSKQVYLYYKGSRISRLSVDNGYFTPRNVGVYEIVYSVADGYNNISECSILVEAVEGVENLFINFDDNNKLEYFIGETVSIPKAIVTGGAGKSKVNTKVFYDGEHVQTTNGTFVAENCGEYIIEYVATDYNNKSVYETLKINVYYNEQIRLSRSIRLPNAFIGGVQYTLDTPSGYCYDGAEKKEIMPVITVDDVAVDGGVWTATAGRTNAVTVKYTYTYRDKMLEKTFVVPIVVASEFPNDYKNYFLLDDNVSIPRLENGEIEFVFTHDGYASFAKDIPVTNLRIDLKVVSTFDKDLQSWTNYNNASSFNVTLTDVQDSAKKVVFSIIKVSDKETKISVNGGKEHKFDAILSESNPFTFAYYNDAGYVRTGGVKVYVDTFADGTKFDGFSGNRANISFSTTDANDFRILLSSLAGQGFFLDSDLMPPELVVVETLKSTVDVNTSIKTDVAYCVDVLQVHTNTIVSVISPNDELLIDCQPANISYDVHLTEYGTYTLLYQGIDAEGNVAEKTLVVNVVDKTSPTVELNKNELTCAVNEKVELPVATFSDNLTETENIECYISYLSPNGKEYLIDTIVTDNTFTAKLTFDQEGEWNIKYLVVDGNGNISVASASVVVGELKSETEETRDIEFIKNGQSDYSLIIPSTSSGTELPAAYKIQDYIYKSTGFTLPVKTDAEISNGVNKFISIGLTSLYNQSNLNIDVIGFGDGYAIKEKDGNFYILGGEGSKSYLYAAYEYLNIAINLEPYYLTEVSFDCMLDVYMPKCDISSKPDFNYRSMLNTEISGSDSPSEYQEYIRYNETKFSNMGYTHTSFMWLPTATYYKDHPEWYTGTSNLDQLCWSQQDMLEELSKVVIENVKKNPASTHFHIAQNDGSNWCTCQACKDSLAKYGTNSAVLIKGLNFVAKKVQEYVNANEKGREVYISTFAYTSTESAPVKLNAQGIYEPIDDEVVLEPNIAVRLAPVYTDYAHTFYDQVNKSFADNIKGWSAICENLLIWNYGTNYSYYFIPFCNWNSIQDNYKFYKENNVKGLLEQGGTRTKQTGFWEFRNYLTSKLMWNTDIDVQETTVDFFVNYYKDGSQWMYKYFDEYRQWFNIIEKKYTLINGGIYARYGDVPEAFPLNLIERWEEYVENAKAEIEYIKNVDLEYYNELYRRFDKETLFFDYVKLFNYETSFSDIELKQMRLAFKEKCLKHDITQIDEGASLSAMFKVWGV